MALIATNILGQNTPAIAATEAQYAEMWAHDAAAMYGYAGLLGSGHSIEPVHRVAADHQPQRADPQSAAVAQAGATPAGTQQATLSYLHELAPRQLRHTCLIADVWCRCPRLSATTAPGLVLFHLFL